MITKNYPKKKQPIFQQPKFKPPNFLGLNKIIGLSLIKHGVVKFVKFLLLKINAKSVKKKVLRRYHNFSTRFPNAKKS